MLKIWQLTKAEALKVFGLMAPYLLAADRANPTTEEWFRYQTRLESACWN